MKRNIISNQIKTVVAERAGFSCEYCLLPDKVKFFGFHIDHIKSIKHGGFSLIDNLAYCCPIVIISKVLMSSVLQKVAILSDFSIHEMINGTGIFNLLMVLF